MFEGGREYRFNKNSGNDERVETAQDRRIRESIKRADAAREERNERLGLNVDPFAAFA
jgi:hypothetical protein